MREEWDGAAFKGAKIALIHGAALLAFLRDDKPGIPFPGLWDLAGGGREGEESPAACALRETEEEFGLVIPPERVVWQRGYPAADGSLPGWFLVAPVTRAEVSSVRFGDEGQFWELMPIHDFLRHPVMTPHLPLRLADYLDAQAPSAGRSAAG